ncbi:hypothetical protein HY469_04490 [Candidatus Roizmanbacteria bacterium]|nr:hypothetical protein [Candidatus Roizmanbacteria bacterium]
MSRSRNGKFVTYFLYESLFLNDYLYVVGEQEIVVLDETTWERVNK